ncbi:hypothetical protein CEXT_625851 [Caerostris extrusa]|uniref:Uncharacterized protein n=1 Tax=Caerostris extrusa TaxID=172846 RepID=A0AAV4XK55_CAEEX|nr:hypothetical protein CEXT_625851 [Caerostris extrusa]
MGLIPAEKLFWLQKTQKRKQCRCRKAPSFKHAPFVHHLKDPDPYRLSSQQAVCAAALFIASEAYIL